MKNSVWKKIIISLCVLLVISCTVDWNENLYDHLQDDAYVTVTFKSSSDSDALSFSKKYLKGSKIKVSDLPSSDTDSLVRSIKPGYTLVHWNFEGNPLADTLNLSDTDVTLVGNWSANTNTPYKVQYLLQSLDDPDDSYSILDHEEIRTGTTDSTGLITLNSDIYGFTPNDTSVSYTINGDGSTVVQLKYNRNTYTFNFLSDEVSDYFYTVDGKYEESVGEISLDPISRSGYRLYGWTTQSSTDITVNSYDEAMTKIEPPPKNFTKDLTFYPVWGPEAYKITFKDHLNKPLYGSYEGASKDKNDDSYVMWSDSSPTFTIKKPDFTNPSENTITFTGWYLDENCTDTPLEDAGDTYTLNRSSLSSDPVLYAKWEYEKIYVDPKNGSDSNNGMTPLTPVKTVLEGNNYRKTALSANFYLLSAVEDVEDVTWLNASNVYRYSTTNSFDFPMIYLKNDQNMQSGSELSLITFDGGAEWEYDANGTYYFYDMRKKNSGKTSTVPLIINEGVMNIGFGVVLQNNCNISSSGGAIKNSGILNIVGMDGTEVKIKNNYSKSGGGGIYNTGSGILSMKYAFFKENATEAQGGAIYTDAQGIPSGTAFNVILEHCNIKTCRAISSGGGISAIASSIKVKIDQTIITTNIVSSKNEGSSSGSGGGIYIRGGDLTLKDSTIVYNTSAAFGGGITVGQNGNATIESSTISNNKSNNGGGISCSAGAKVTLSSGTYIENNNAKANGKGVYIANSTVSFNGGSVTSPNDVYTSSSTIKLSTVTSPAAGSVYATITPSSYEANKVIVTKDNDSLTDFNTWFAVSNDSEGKAWDLVMSSGNAVLNNLYSETGGGIPLPSDIRLEAKLDENDKIIVLRTDITPNTQITPDNVSIKLTQYGIETGKSWTALDSFSIPSDLIAGQYVFVVSGTYDGALFYKEIPYTKSGD